HTGIYHVMLRGINGQIIFEDREDSIKLLETIKYYREESGYEIYGYCLMNNHIHLLIKEGCEELGTVFRRIGARYVYWYNRKYGRRGHLFQDRYKSEVVENDGYLLTVLRYIHQNPLKACIVKNIEQYPWSSYQEYIGKKDICETAFPLSIFSKDNKKAVKLFKDFHAKEKQDHCLDYEETFRINDLEAAEIIKKSAEIDSTNKIQSFDQEHRNKLIKEFKKKGLSIRQIERLTGVSFGVIRRL
ncbi:transposase, partial [Anoxynatronum sibiricum]